MRYVIETHKTPETAVQDLRAVAARHGFGVLHAYDLRETLTAKGFPQTDACCILEVCNPRQASEVLAEDMAMSIALPCRITVFQENGHTRIATALPTKLLASLSDSPALAAVAADVEATMKSIMHEAA